MLSRGAIYYGKNALNSISAAGIAPETYSAPRPTSWDLGKEGMKREGRDEKGIDSANAVIIAVTRCQILRLKCTNFNFGWDSAVDPLREVKRSPRPPSWNLGEKEMERERREGGV